MPRHRGNKWKATANTYLMPSRNRSLFLPNLSQYKFHHDSHLSHFTNLDFMICFVNLFQNYLKMNPFSQCRRYYHLSPSIDVVYLCLGPLNSELIPPDRLGQQPLPVNCHYCFWLLFDSVHLNPPSQREFCTVARVEFSKSGDGPFGRVSHRRIQGGFGRC